MTPALLAAKLALGPVLLPQGLWVRRTALRLPEAEGAREGVLGPGRPAMRVLVVGDSSAAGVGVADQAQALALPLAQGLHERLQQTVGWQLVARTGVDAAQAADMVHQAPLKPADVLVGVLGVNDVTGQSSVAQFIGAIEQLWKDVQFRTGARWAVFCGLPPMHRFTALPHPLRWYLGRYADGLDHALQGWLQAQALGHLPLRWSMDTGMLARDGFHPGPRAYPQWADRLADLLIEQRARWGTA